MHPVDAARDVLRRSLGPGAEAFELELFQESGGLDAFEVSARAGKICVSATSAIALCRGAYQYLRQHGYGQLSWSGDPLVLPSNPKDAATVRIESVAAHRHYLSVCTYGYSAAWWDWERWEQELDWMALHGINMPLLLCGTEAVSRRVFRALGLDEEPLAAYFSGPAYLCWHRLGNLTGHMGPLPDSWFSGQQELQVRILRRARELGMRPIVPGFSGFVPSALERLMPGVALRSAEPWAGFEQTTYLDPRSAEFREVARQYLDEYRSTYGPAHHFLCELFAEQVPCLDPQTELDDLREIGRATWSCLVEADPEANWVMQGWPFFFARDYWTPEKSAALLDAVPAGRAFVLDLATESLETWRLHPAMREKGWMFNVVHNFGQNTALHGDLQGFADRAHAALGDSASLAITPISARRNSRLQVRPEAQVPLPQRSGRGGGEGGGKPSLQKSIRISPFGFKDVGNDKLARGRMQGMGISPEGIDQNPVVYEFLTDLMWASPAGAPALSVRDWIRSYAQARYGKPGAEDAWELLHGTLYGAEPVPHFRYSWCYRPGDQPLVPSRDPLALRPALEALFDSRATLGGSSSYRRDLVDVAKTWLGAIADRCLQGALETGESAPRAMFFDALSDLDLLLSTRPEHRLSTWLAAARSLGVNPSEADHYERNARSLITWWGGPFLFDYAAREWSGLTAEFHAERWRMWFEWQDSRGAYPDFDAWERGWSEPSAKRCSRTSMVRCNHDVADSIEVVETLLAKWSSASFPPDPACHVTRLEPQRMTNGVVSADLGHELNLAAAACLPMFGQGIKARYSTEISQDGENWMPVSAYAGAPETCRGSRVRTLGRPLRHLRFAVDIVQGTQDQLFQLVLFEPAPPT